MSIVSDKLGPGSPRAPYERRPVGAQVDRRETSERLGEIRIELNYVRRDLDGVMTNLKEMRAE